MVETRGEGNGAAATGDGPAEPHAERISHYEKAAEQAVIGPPLPGEDLDTPYLEDAQMWHSVYTELLEFKRTLIRDTDEALRRLSTPGREEVSKTDAVILAAEAQRFRQRLSLWERRCAELGPRDAG